MHLAPPGDMFEPMRMIGCGPLAGVIVDDKGQTTSFDPKAVTTIILSGPWNNEKAAFEVKQLVLEPPTAADLLQRKEANENREKRIASLKKQEADVVNHHSQVRRCCS